MIQGDIYQYKFKEPNKKRPVLILTKLSLIPGLNTTTVAEITTTIRGNESEVILDISDGMPKDCVANLVNIQTIPKNKPGKFITHLSDERMREVFEAIRFAFGFGRF
ncbi:MAG: type II toxin-antitoxin system PemK/MazF family toxin [Acidobacteriota bacterium]|jgi:mRNA interferase MazF|nr:type II toxin-antitoxin system PemK/MazF family toxin [Acidobacteriota bacterium]